MFLYVRELAEGSTEISCFSLNLILLPSLKANLRSWTLR